MKTIHQNYFNEKGEVYCKRLNKLITNLNKCGDCEMCVGSLQGQGVECYWQDVVNDTYMVTIEDPTEELMRVSKLIDSKLIKKGVEKDD